MYQVKVYPLSNSKYASQIYGGLFDLAADKRIELSFTDQPLTKISERDLFWTSKENNRIAYLEVSQDHGPTLKICYDFLDGPEIISMNGLENCDVYFKRSYSHDYLYLDQSSLQQWRVEHPEWMHKILPFGLNFPYHSDHETDHYKRAVLFCNAVGLFDSDPKKAMRIVTRATLRRHQKAGRKQRIGEISPYDPANANVFYQVRLFDPKDQVLSDEVEEVNRRRVEVIAALKEGLGDQFLGGVVRDAYAEKYCPELITNLNTSRDKYLELVNNSLISIYTRGLRDSTGWKFPEFLAKSRCIVSEPLAYALPVPLVEDQNLLQFTTPDEALEACKRLLADPELASQMRMNNFNYYNTYVKPSALVLHTFKQAFDLQQAHPATEHKLRA